MPVVFRQRGFRFHFYSDEGKPREPAHVHVARAGADAKFWLHPEVAVAYNRGYDARTLNTLQTIFEEHRQKIEDRWNDYFG